MVNIVLKRMFYLYQEQITQFPSVLWCCWSGNWKGIRPVKAANSQWLFCYSPWPI